jgi:RNA polymerase sigma factor (sigma-70 family)
MNDRRQDFELLQGFTRHGEQSAFADLVRRHLDLVFATALRKVEDTGAAQEVAQNVFTKLARKAWQFAPDDSLPAWLHKAALLESKSWLRGELRLRRRERTAAELGTTMNTPQQQPAFQALLPLLDEALLSLREKDRTALLLRYYEQQSLREVGVAFGVSEDTAQKRVQSALQKLTEFFTRHGFKTASVAAAAGALQNTATSASATVVSAVVGAAMQAPPSAVGLSAWFGRLAQLSRGQTVAVCVGLAVIPLVWQLLAGRAAGEEARRVRAQLQAARDEAASAQRDVDRLQATASRLEQSIAQAGRAAESAQAFDVWKKKMRGLMLGADYRWSDESPFARIPKSVLPGLNKLIDSTPFEPPGVIRPYARELLGLSSAEREGLETALKEHFADLEARRAAAIYQTNTVSPPPGSNLLASTTFVVPELAEEGKQLVKQVLEDAKGILGEERWRVAQARTEGVDGGGSKLALVNWGGPPRMDIGMGRDGNNSPMVTAVGNIGGPARDAPPSAGPVYSLNIVGYSNWKLAMFLPEDDPNRVAGVEGFLHSNAWGEALAQHALPWLQQQAITHFGQEAPR